MMNNAQSKNTAIASIMEQKYQIKNKKYDLTIDF